mgnify:CR=1 FL=1
MFSKPQNRFFGILTCFVICLLLQQVQAQQIAVNKYKTNFDTTTSDEVFFPIKSVKRINEDSALITIEYGMADGIFLGGEANVMSSHNSGGGPTRETVVYMGPANFISLSEFEATFSVNVYKKFKKEESFYRLILNFKDLNDN